MKVEIAAAKHADGIIKIYTPHILEGVASFEEHAPSRPEMIKRIEEVNKLHCWLVLTDKDSVLGYAYGGTHRARAAYRHTVETSIYMSAETIGKQLAKPLYQFLLSSLKKQGYVTALAGITLPNAASEKFHESIGFSQIGKYARVGYKFGKWHSTGWYQMDLQEGLETAPELLTINEVCRENSWINERNKLEEFFSNRD